MHMKLSATEYRTALFLELCAVNTKQHRYASLSVYYNYVFTTHYGFLGCDMSIQGDTSVSKEHATCIFRIKVKGKDVFRLIGT